MNKRLPKLLCALIAVCLLLTGLAPAMGEDADLAFAPYAETLELGIGQSVDSTVTFPEGMDWENNDILNAAENALNINVRDTWQAQQGNDFNQKVNLSIASNDIPDGLVVNYTQFSSMVRFGLVADLSEVYEKYASPVMRELLNVKANGAALEVATFDGKLYGLPNQPVPDDDYCLTWVRKDWLDKLGLAEPKTIEDLRAIALEFVTKDPGGNGEGNTVGIVGPDSNTEHPTFNFLQPGNASHRLDAIFTAFGSFPGFWLEGEDGPVYGTLLPETREALAFMQEMYKEGSLDPQIGVRKDSNEAVVSGQAGIFFGPWWMGYFPLPDAIAQNPEADWHSYLLTDVNGKATSHMQSVCNTFAVMNKNYANPEVVIKLNNVLLRDEHSYDITTFTMGMYPLRVAMAPMDELKVTRDSLAEVYKGEKTVDDFVNDPYYDFYKLIRSDVRDILTTKTGDYDDFSISQWNTKSAAWARLYSIVVGAKPFYTQDVNHVYSLLYTQTPQVEAKYATLQKMEDEMIMRVIVGQADLSEYDTFCEQWLAQGGADITAEVAATIAG